jgi:hypothetical protein
MISKQLAACLVDPAAAAAVVVVVAVRLEVCLELA